MIQELSAAQKMALVAEAAKKAKAVPSEVLPAEEEVLLTQDVIDMQHEILTRGIARGVELFEFGLDDEQFASMTEKEQVFTRLLDPLLWVMRESIISYEHGDCEDCKNRRERDGNSLGVAIAAMLIGADSSGDEKSND